MSSTTDLGVCGHLSDAGKCPGRIVFAEQVGDLIEGTCSRCGSHQAVPALKADPSVLVQRRIEQARLPAKFFGVVFEESAENRGALQAVRDWVRDYGSARLPAPALWGQPGRGKSHLLTAICVRLIRERSQSVMFASTRSLLRDLQDFDGTAAGVWQRASTVDVLAVDDFGAERATEWRHDQLADLIDLRYEEDRPILVATNFPPAGWAEAMDSRTASRLRGMVFPVELRGPDRRVAQGFSTRTGVVIG